MLFTIALFGLSMLAQKFGFQWPLVAAEAVVMFLVHQGLTRMIRARPMRVKEEE
jgi:hypothetical protein